MAVVGELAAEAVGALRFVARKRLEPAGWRRVEATLAALEAALAAGDERATRDAIRDIDGVRAPTRLGDRPDPAGEPVPIPPGQRERINRLIDEILPGTPGDPPAGGGQAGG
jgi:hypothetical protein